MIETEQSRRDDLESLGHVFMYFLRGALPWQGLKAATNKQKYEKIGEKKQSTAVRDLCEGYPGKSLPNPSSFDRFHQLLSLSEEFGVYLQYTRKLGFEETPDYDFLRDLFNKVLKNLGETDDGVYDWMLLNNGKGWEVQSEVKRPSKWITSNFYALSTAPRFIATNPTVREPLLRLTMQRLRAAPIQAAATAKEIIPIDIPSSA